MTKEKEFCLNTCPNLDKSKEKCIWFKKYLVGVWETPKEFKGYLRVKECLGGKQCRSSR